MAEAQRLFLVDVGDVDHVRDFADHLQLAGLTAVLQIVLELEGDVEMVDDGTLVPASHDDDLVDASGDRFLDAVLDDGLVDDRQHLLRLRLGRRQEARAESGGRKDGLANGRHGLLTLLLGLLYLLARRTIAECQLDALDTGIIDHHLRRTGLPFPGA